MTKNNLFDIASNMYMMMAQNFRYVTLRQALMKRSASKTAIQIYPHDAMQCLTSHTDSEELRFFERRGEMRVLMFSEMHQIDRPLLGARLLRRGALRLL